jgi:hypothetical protein
MRTAIVLTAFACLSMHPLFAQDDQGVADKVLNFPSKLFKKLDKKSKDLDQGIDKQTEIYLKKLSKQESKLRQQLYKTDSVKAARLFANDPEKQYETFIAKMNSQEATDVHSMGPQYLPFVDSMTSSLSFLSKNTQLLNNSKILPADVENSLNQVKRGIVLLLGIITRAIWLDLKQVPTLSLFFHHNQALVQQRYQQFQQQHHNQPT